MTAFEMSQTQYEQQPFTIGKSKVVWEAADYRENVHKVRITRVTETGGKPFLMGLRYRTRYVKPDTVIKVIQQYP